MSKKHNKPVGKLNPKIIRGGKAESAPNRFIFPNTKNEIEKKVASTFLNLISKNEKYDLSVGYRLIENPENNLDFFVECPESFYLELTEITPPGKMKGGYEKLSYEHNIGEHLEFARTAHVVPIAGGPVRDQSFTVLVTHLARFKRFYHLMLVRHTTNPKV